MPLLILVAALVILDILAYYVGIDSRDGFNQTHSVRWPSARHGRHRTVALSLLAASSIATLDRHGAAVAAAPPRPWPASGGDSLAAVIQDLLTVLLYMVIADILVH